ncbi:MAG: sulfite exporter TauE/SafE family protein [Crocinitomicaceae bacterium]
MDHLALFIFLALIAEILGTIGGFGSSVFFIPIAAFFLDFYSALGITAIFHVSSNLTKITMFRKGFDKKLVLSMGIPAILFVILGAYLSQFVASDGLEIGLAIFLIVMSIVFLIFKNFSIKPTNTSAILGGIFSGGIAGLIGTGGAIRGMTLTSFRLKPEIFIATSAIIDFGVDAGRSVVYWQNGYMHSDDLYVIPFLIGASIIGTFIGKKILDKIPEERFRVLVLSLILITGASTILKYVFF